MDINTKIIIVICEGETEVEFCKLLNKYLGYQNYKIIPKNLCGNCNWDRIKDFIIKNLKENKTAIITTMIDYYGLKYTTFPNWQRINCIDDKRKKISHLEEEMYNEINNSRFIPYLQLHEFEAMIFNNIDIFDINFEPKEFNRNVIQDILNDFPDPEMINDKKQTSPSHRLKNVIPNYDKIVYGNILVESIGLKNIYNKNQHFKEWIDKIR